MSCHLASPLHLVWMVFCHLMDHPLVALHSCQPLSALTSVHPLALASTHHRIVVSNLRRLVNFPRQVCQWTHEEHPHQLEGLSLQKVGHQQEDHLHVVMPLPQELRWEHGYLQHVMMLLVEEIPQVGLQMVLPTVRLEVVHPLQVELH